MENEARRIGIVGTGMIASSLAVLCAGHGRTAIVLARSDEAERRCASAFAGHLAAMVEHGVLEPSRAQACEGYLEFARDYRELADVEVVFECVIEDVAVKQAIYRNIGEACSHVRAICSVSSSITPDELSAGLDDYLAARIIVTHPFNPFHMVPYVELCGGTRSDEASIAFAKDLLEQLDRKPVVLKRPAPGFIGNRLQFALWREALNIVQSGIADPEDVDACLKYSFCPRYTSIGIFEHFDNGGLLLNETTCARVFPELSNAVEPPEILEDKIAAGDLGVPTGRGFYDWRNADMGDFRERMYEPYWKFCSWDAPEE